jgi:hypothetical protein
MTAENETIITKAIKEAIPDLVTIAVDIVNDIRESGWHRAEIEQDLDQIIKSEYRDNRHTHTNLGIKVNVAAQRAVIHALGLQEIVHAVEAELMPRVIEEVRQTLQKQLDEEQRTHER